MRDGADPLAYAKGWIDLAACRGRDTSLWFKPATTFECSIAVAVCRRCPVRARCLAEAMDEERDAPVERRFGVRGGLTAAQRLSGRR